MEIRRAVPVVKTDRPEQTRAFYEGFLGFRLAMEKDGLLMFASTSTPTTQVIVAWASPTAMDPAAVDIDISVEVDDVDDAYEQAQADGREIVRTIREEPWGVRRFFVRDPAGRTINVVSHLAG